MSNCQSINQAAYSTAVMLSNGDRSVDSSGAGTQARSGGAGNARIRSQVAADIGTEHEEHEEDWKQSDSET